MKYAQEPLFEGRLFKNRIDESKPELIYNEWLSHEQAALYLKISTGELRNKTSNGHIPYYKIGRKNLYKLSELRDLILSNKRGGRSGN